MFSELVVPLITLTTHENSIKLIDRIKLTLQLVGGILTYFVLIYQTRDSNSSMEMLLKSADFKAAMQFLYDNMTNITHGHHLA